MKQFAKISVAVLVLAGASSLAVAAKTGTYVGGGLGLSGLSTPDKYLLTRDQVNSLESIGVTVKQTKDRTGLGGRLFAGYNFNENFGIEAGFTHFADASYKSDGKAIDADTNKTISEGYVKTNNKLNSFDLVGKAYFPVSDGGFNIYALGGVAHVKSSFTTKAAATNLPPIDDFKNNINKIRPTYGVGVSYDVPDSQITTNLEFKRIQGISNSDRSKELPSANLVALNVAYNFG